MGGATTSGARCAALSRASQEPLAGTALEGLRYVVMVPFRGTWAPKPLRSPGLPPPLVERLTALPAHARPLLVKAPRRHPGDRGGADARAAGGARPSLWVADVVAGTVRRFTAPSWEELAGRDLLAGPVKDGGDGGRDAPSAAAPPLVLVCAHGRRDRCCAVDGVPLALALEAQGVWVWESSHLGGHRFAATALSLPDGYQYGRLTAEDAPALASALRRRALFQLDRVRGHVGRPRPAQAAELHARQRWGLSGLDGVHVEEVARPPGEGWVYVVRRQGGAPMTLRVRREGLAVPLPASCGAAPKPSTRWVCEPAAD